MSRQFHSLVTTSHAWRIAFSRYFPGIEALNSLETSSESSCDDSDSILPGRRVFTRLTALASWRSEYILRTRLLRSLSRGKPAEAQGGNSGSSRSGLGQNGNAQVTYNSNLFTSVNHIHANFGTGLNKRAPRFIHGADEIGSASSSDPSISRADHWGFSDPQSFLQFVDQFPGDSEYGLGAGDIVGVPNSMDLSQKHGMVYAVGSPGGLVYYRSTEEQRGRILAMSRTKSTPERGIPRLNASIEAMCSVWIAKSSSITVITEGLVGILSGSSTGVLTSFSLGTDSLHERRLEKGEVTARWVLSPGVPIVAVSVDNEFSPKRHDRKRIWAVALNALGEIFYLTNIPKRRVIDRATKITEGMLDDIAWETGRTVHWNLVEVTRRSARPNPFDRSGVDGSYSPRSSWDGIGLSKEQLVAETKEIETFLAQKPKHFRKICKGWDMRRRLEVDFAGDSDDGAEEAIFVIDYGLDESQSATIQRFTRYRIEYHLDPTASTNDELTTTIPKNEKTHTSVFGSASTESKSWSFARLPYARSSSADSIDMEHLPEIVEEWRTSVFSLGGPKTAQITTSAVDMSTLSLLTITEDPLLSLNASSASSTPLSSPLGLMPRLGSASNVPGQRARFLAVGTNTGIVLIWDMRSPSSSNTHLTNTIQPIRIIHTDSPQISCIALSALYLVHGGNDGLVQTWDPLASTTQPIRTLNSRFSSRARRRLVQAEASSQGVGINLFAAGAIYLDPDPTVLRGIVSLGTHLRYWNYSSSAADQYKSSKRRLRRSERGTNQAGDRFSGTGRGALMDYIANERFELEREKESRGKEEERLAGRFGLGLLGPDASEDEIMAYALLLSKEAAQSDELRRKSESESESGDRVVTSGTSIEILSSPSRPQPPSDTDTDADLAEAIRLSLQQPEGSSFPSESSMPTDFLIKYAKKSRPLSTSPLGARHRLDKSSGTNDANDDLDFALQLSLVEEESRKGVDFPDLTSTITPNFSDRGKGKGRSRS